MFVMKAAPVAALRSKWEPFGPPGTCRLPGCFPEPPEAVASASVSARVQMIISSLQQGVSQEPPATLRSHRAERGREPRPAGRPSAHRGQPLLAATSPQEPSALDSDSDDSVDRDIEQAIQEYLRAKGGAGGRYRAQPARPSTQAPPKLTANPGGQTGEEGSEAQGSASPVSVSSDDSFEQGIRAEIERFLSEKKLQEAPRWVRPEEQGAEPSEAPARATPKPGREPPAKAVPQQDPTAASKEFVFRKPPRWAKVNGQPRGLRAKGTAAPEARLPAPRPEAAPHRGSSGQRPPRTQSVAAAQRASDSSSDDGIEEAIQLYQLEKSRREAGTGLAVDSARSALAEAPRRTPARKKPGFGKATDSPSPDAEQPAKLPKAGKAVPAPGEPAARSQAAGRPCGRTDVPTELLCPEPILPGPAEPGSAPCPPPPAEPSHPDGDGSAVDSDDSIEQEIRSFLALRMQAGHPLARAESGLQPTQGPPSQPLPSKSQDRSPHCRRRRGPGCGTTRPLASRKAREMKDGGQGRAHPALQPPGETCRQPVPARAAGLGDAHGPQGHEKAEEKESSEDKSSSLDSDEDLDTAIKDLLRSKRKARRRGRDPRASGQKKVRFGTAETQSWDKLGSARGGRRESPQVLRSCLSPCRRDCTAGPPRRAPGADRGTPDAAVPGEGTLPATRLRSRAPRGSPRVCEAEPRDRPRPDAGPCTLSDDTSSVDSDDSIELEIRKFLAEKAKESSSVGSAEAQGGEPGALAPQPGMCTRSRRARAALPAAGVQSAATLLAQGGKGTPFAELAATLAGCEPAAPRLTGGVVTAKACPGGRNSAYRDQSLRGAEPAAADTCQTPKAPTFPGNLGSQGLLSPSPGPQADLTLPWSDFGRPGRLPSPWPLNSEGRGPAWTAGLRTESEKGAEGSARGSTSLALDPGKSLAFGGFSPLLSTQLFQFGRGVSWGKHAGLFSTQLGLPPHSPPFAAFGAAQAGPSPVFGGPHLLLRKEGGSWPGRRPPAGLSSHDGRSMDLRYRREAMDADGKDQEALGSDASEGSDVSVEGGVG